MKFNEEMGASPRRYRHPKIELPASSHSPDVEKPACRRDLLPSHLQRMRRFCQIRWSKSIPTHIQVMQSKSVECLLHIYIDGEICPQRWLPGNVSDILGCPNLEIPASDDQRWKLVGIWTVLRCIFVPNLEIVTSIVGELWHGQAQNRIKFDFGAKFDLEGHNQSSHKTTGILTNVFYIPGLNLVILP